MAKLFNGLPATDGDTINGLSEKVNKTTDNFPITSAESLNGLSNEVKRATGDFRNDLESSTNRIVSSRQELTQPLAEPFKATVDRIVSPEQPAMWWEQIKAFWVLRPALSAFLILNLAFTGIPLCLFIGFTLGTFIFALLVCVSIAVFCAVTFALFCTGLALIVLLPTIFFTTIAACSVFLAGFVGFHLLRWISNRSNRDTTPPQQDVNDYEASISEFQKKWDSLSEDKVCSGVAEIKRETANVDDL